MIALTAKHRKSLCKHNRNRGEWSVTIAWIELEISSHAIVSGILLLPYFGPSPAPLGCDN